MGNHFHLLCHTPKGNLDQVMHSFLRSTSIKINNRNKDASHSWNGRYKWSMINSQAHYYQVYRYIYQNPVRAGICHRVQDYPFTTFRCTRLPIHSSLTFTFGGEEGELIWLNQIYLKEDIDLIKLGLKKHQFDINKRKINLFNRLSLPG
jgi:hypothetical protein